MLKNRLICALLLQDDLLVQSIRFKTYLPIGRAKIAVEFMTNWDIDEIIILDMTATREGRSPNLKLIERVSQKCFVPLTYGGGIRSLKHIQSVIRAGADKISLNATALQNSKFISESSRAFGSQCIVVSIDVKKTGEGRHEVFGDSGRLATGLDPVQWAQECEKLGAGELLLNSVDRDGTKLGYDLELVRNVSTAVSIPVITLGGVGIMQHFVEGILQGKASAVAAANIFQHIEHSPLVAKSFLANAQIPTRLNTKADYKGFIFDPSGRILKQDDTYLENVWLEKNRLEKI